MGIYKEWEKLPPALKIGIIALLCIVIYSFIFNSSAEVPVKSSTIKLEKSLVQKLIDKIQFAVYTKENFLEGLDYGAADTIINANKNLPITFKLDNIDPLLANKLDKIYVSKVKYAEINNGAVTWKTKTFTANDIVLFSEDNKIKAGENTVEFNKSDLGLNDNQVLYGNVTDKDHVEFTLKFVINSIEIDVGPFPFGFDLKTTSYNPESITNEDSNQMSWLSGMDSDSLSVKNMKFPIYYGLDVNQSDASIELLWTGTTTTQDGQKNVYNIKLNNGTYVKNKEGTTNAIVYLETFNVNKGVSIIRTINLGSNGIVSYEQLSYDPESKLFSMKQHNDSTLLTTMAFIDNYHLNDEDEIKSYLLHKIKTSKSSTFYNKNGKTIDSVPQSININSNDTDKNYKRDVDDYLAKCDLNNENGLTTEARFDENSCYDISSFTKNTFAAYSTELSRTGYENIENSKNDVKSAFFDRFKYNEVDGYTLNKTNDTDMKCNDVSSNFGKYIKKEDNTRLGEIVKDESGNIVLKDDGETPETVNNFNVLGFPENPELNLKDRFEASFTEPLMLEECKELCSGTDKCYGYTFKRHYSGQNCYLHSELDIAENNTGKLSCYERIAKYQLTYTNSEGETNIIKIGNRINTPEFLYNIFTYGDNLRKSIKNNYKVSLDELSDISKDTILFVKKDDENNTKQLYVNGSGSEFSLSGLEDAIYIVKKVPIFDD